MCLLSQLLQTCFCCAPLACLLTDLLTHNFLARSLLRPCFLPFVLPFVPSNPASCSFVPISSAFWSRGRPSCPSTLPFGLSCFSSCLSILPFGPTGGCQEGPRATGSRGKPGAHDGQGPAQPRRGTVCQRCHPYGTTDRGTYNHNQAEFSV